MTPHAPSIRGNGRYPGHVCIQIVVGDRDSHLSYHPSWRLTSHELVSGKSSRGDNPFEDRTFIKDMFIIRWPAMARIVFSLRFVQAEEDRSRIECSEHNIKVSKPASFFFYRSAIPEYLRFRHRKISRKPFASCEREVLLAYAI
jgi:hypothetical protein